MKNLVFFFTIFFISSIGLKGQNILTLNDQAEVLYSIQKDRIENLLPRLMKKHNIDLWVIITREYMKIQ
mgnify:FL=1